MYVTVKFCRLCDARYTLPNSSLAARLHFPARHPGVTPTWRTRREQRELPLRITYLHGARP